MGQLAKKKRSPHSAGADFVSQQQGTALFELAIALPFLLLFSVSMFDLASVLYHHSALLKIAREGARFAAIAPTSPPPTSLELEVTARVTALFTTEAAKPVYRFAPGPPTVTIQLSPGGRDVKVEVAARYRGLFPLFNGLQIGAEAVGPRI